MLNDKGFSRIISVVIVIVIVILVGVVISISSASNSDSINLVDIIENEATSNTTKPISKTTEFIGLDIFAQGYKIIDQTLDNESEIKIERVDGKYVLLTSNIHQDNLLMIKDFWQDKEAGARELFELILKTGELEEVFSLPNTKVDNKQKFITGAVYSLDKQKIAYSTNLYDENGSEFLEAGSKDVEIWEYDMNKDVHTLIANVSGGLYSGLKILGYDDLQENLILYQFTADAGAGVLGKIYFLNIKEGVVDKNSFQGALDNYFSQTEGDENRIKTAGYPYLSPNGDYIAFVLPSIAYQGKWQGNSNEVVLYDIKLHQITSIYSDKTEDASGSILSSLYWVNRYLYIPTPTQLVMYSVEAKKLRSIYIWSGEYESPKLYSVTEDGVLIKLGDSTPPVYIDFTEATENELLGMENFEYINIYYK